MPRLAATKDPRWTGKRAFVWGDGEIGEFYLAIDGTGLGGLVTGRVEPRSPRPDDGEDDGKEDDVEWDGKKKLRPPAGERWFLRPHAGGPELDDMFESPGLAAKVLRACTRCGHEECPGCEGSCDTLEYVEDGDGKVVDADPCCDGECAYADEEKDPLHFLAYRLEAAL